jgi:hypothetical protein
MMAVLANNFEFEAELLVRALRATLERRKTALPTTRPVALTPAFFEAPTKRTQWSGFLRRSGITDGKTLAETVEVVAAVVEGPLGDAASGNQRRARWLPSGPWR